jgi:hypothetical protein
MSEPVNTASRDWHSHVRGWKEIFTTQSDSYPTREHRRDVFIRTLFKDTVRHSSGEKIYRMSSYDILIHRRLFKVWWFQRSPQLLDSLTSSRKSNKPQLEDQVPGHETEDIDFGIHFEPALAASLHGWAFCVTQKGYIGLVTKYASVGDHICVVHGASVPLVLRCLGQEFRVEGAPEGCEPEWFTLGGTAYIHGIMDGEATATAAFGDERTICLI